MESFWVSSDLAIKGVHGWGGLMGVSFSALYVCELASDFFLAYLMTEAYEEGKTEDILLIFVLGDLWRCCAERTRVQIEAREIS